MSKQFVQVSAQKNNGDFMHCSNLTLMANQKMTYKQSLRELQVMADQYALNGFKIDWIVEEFEAVDYEIYAEILLDQ